MITNEEIKSITQEIVEEAFFEYFSKPKKETSHILLDRLFPQERRTASTIIGLQTSLGTSFWEKLAKKFAQKNDFEIIPNKELKKFSSNAEPKQLKDLIEKTKRKREDQNGSLYTFRQELKSLKKIKLDKENLINMTKGKGADLILKKNNKTYIFDIKTVQVNANNGNTFNETIILWIAHWSYIKNENPYNIDARIIFPYNSSNENDTKSWWDNYAGRIKPLTKDEVLIGNEFWSFLTDNENALLYIIEAFEELTSKQDFINLYKEVFICKNEKDLKNFANKVKIAKVERLNNIKLKPGQEINLRKNLIWIKERNGKKIEFKESIGKLLKK